MQLERAIIHRRDEEAKLKSEQPNNPKIAEYSS